MRRLGVVSVVVAMVFLGVAAVKVLAAIGNGCHDGIATPVAGRWKMNCLNACPGGDPCSEWIEVVNANTRDYSCVCDPDGVMYSGDEYSEGVVSKCSAVLRETTIGGITAYQMTCWPVTCLNPCAPQIFQGPGGGLAWACNCP